MQLKIAWLYPDLMSTYGDRGNIICLKARCKWRGIETDVIEATLGTSVNDLKTADLFFMGGAQDRQQKLASNDLLKNKGPVIKEMVENGTTALFVCAAYQQMGHYYRPAEGDDIKGLGLFDLYTRHFGKDKPRCVGNMVIELTDNQVQLASDRNKYLVGFENHGGRTYLGEKVAPLGKIVVGFGNNGEDKTEGAIYKNAFGSYSHGPILPKNPHFADLLIKLALQKKYQLDVKLQPLDDDLEWRSHTSMLKRLGVNYGKKADCKKIFN